MAKAQVIKNHRRDQKIFRRTAKKMHSKNLTVTNKRGGTRM